MFEDASNTSQGSASKSSLKSDGELAANDTWLESQIVCDRADVAMDGQEDGNLSDYEYGRGEDN